MKKVNPVLYAAVVMFRLVVVVSLIILTLKPILVMACTSSQSSISKACKYLVDDEYQPVRLFIDDMCKNVITCATAVLLATAFFHPFQDQTPTVRNTRTFVQIQE